MNDLRNMALFKVLRAMHLRKPQQEALEAFHNTLTKADENLSEMSVEKLNNIFREKFPTWKYNSNHLEFTFHLATGVGKTRLIGSLIAYLHLASESKNFLIVSPRTEIIRKFLAELQPSHKKYIFVSQALVDYPQIYTANSQIADQTLFSDNSGLNIWVLSPQAFTARNAKIKERNEHSKYSLVEHLQQLDDLVIFFDESHHLNSDSAEMSVWKEELSKLKPKFIMGTTASVNEGDEVNVIYSYDLKKCLNEHKYTKFVNIIPDKKGETIEADDYDHITLRFGLSRLKYKQKLLDDFCDNNDRERVKAVMLVACSDIINATAVTQWLKDELNDSEAVLLVHSKLSENDFVPKLREVENPKSPVKVVVNVSMLTEGWDVSNIYVITPLRAMASSTLVTQIMGRGLRLPFNAQVGNEDIDTLDILCFGNETLTEICDNLINKGYGVNTGGGIRVADPVPTSPTTPPFVPTKKYKIDTLGALTSISIPLFKLNRPILDLNLVTIPTIRPTELHSFTINDPRTIKKLDGAIEFERQNFISIVIGGILSKCNYLSFTKHFKSLEDLLNRFLDQCSVTSDRVPFDPEKIVDHFKKNLDILSKTVAPRYEKLPTFQNIDLTKVEVNVPETFSDPIDANTFNLTLWSRSHKGIPFSGWVRSLLQAVPFDQKNELKVAKIIDRAEEVKWWFRNIPGLLTLPTPAGNYSPDFAMLLYYNDTNVLLEVKGDIYISGEDDDSLIKANAAREWCKAQAEATNQAWEYWLLLDSDISYCETFSDIMDNSDR